MTIQKSKYSLDVDSLLETKITTNSTQDYKIKSGGLIFQPQINILYENKKETIIPTLDGIATEFVDNYDNTFISNELNIEDNEYEKLEIHEFREYLLSYFLSDKYYKNKLNETNANKIIRQNIPLIAILAEKENGSMTYISIDKPFNNQHTKDIFELIEHNQIISITYKNNKPVIKLDENITIPISINNAEKMPIQSSIVENMNETFCWQYLNESEYNNWLKVPISSFKQKENGKYELIVEKIPHPWTLNDPEFWNSSHHTVKLIENFANGNPSLLEYVYIRPTDNTYKSSIETIQNNYGWELALQKPDNTITEKDNEIGILIFFLIGSILFIWLILILHLLINIT